MFAVIQVGSSQYKISQGDSIDVHRLEDKEGATIDLEQILLFANDADIRVGRPYLKDVKVSGKVVKHGLGEKTMSFKFRKRKNYSRRTGHRQKLTTLNITQIAG